MNKSDKCYNVLNIIKGTTVDGPGLRTSIYLAGCPHHCEGCHNPQSWDSNSGTEFHLEEILRVIEEEDFDVTITGGDPLLYPEALEILIEKIKEKGRNVWVYTGYTWEEILSSPALTNAISKADVLVDGRFILNLRDIDLAFRGSSNQRIILVRESLDSGILSLHKSMYL
ncbi:MAG: anaerobic ribonucleoside-triphosphate reductase activating protein [Muribaculaceae bacterium]|nr:anaerobic ribonucleoside-triphosphate reductase activating protein [Muribaculaceae bacterium]